ncbi:hypothetical protein Enr13x_05650 [Stieleria neptunia]|uniref:Uncharacterized protein n=1 Tax=Stieleria neptunia TaxID=2527979 RepID=A0A518HIU3_9BACT|nr:hypothetical protein [Stieleria neptunia]QDV40729.1 hypothetical protein Enr13x_05650 [Stieleria neptunia]
MPSRYEGELDAVLQSITKTIVVMANVSPTRKINLIKIGLAAVVVMCTGIPLARLAAQDVVAPEVLALGEIPVDETRRPLGSLYQRVWEDHRNFHSRDSLLLLGGSPKAAPRERPLNSDTEKRTTITQCVVAFYSVNIT